MKRIYIVDDHPMVCEGLKAVLSRDDDIEVVGCSESAEHALSVLPGLRVDVVLVDYSLPAMSGADLCAALSRVQPATACLMLTTSVEPEHVYESLRVGARGYVLKDVTPQQIRDAVRRVAAGDVYVDPRITEVALLGRSSMPAVTFTDSELQVLELIGGGLSNSEIALRLHVSRGTVKNRVASLLVKLGVRRRAEAVAAGARLGLLNTRAPAPRNGGDRWDAGKVRD
jgi:DNA-binding NarL/FixJ family response regulator